MKKIKTNAEVLLDMLKKDIDWLARIWVEEDPITHEFIVHSTDGRGTEISRHNEWTDAYKAQIAYLNSAEEVGK